jgi:hypothetical protein
LDFFLLDFVFWGLLLSRLLLSRADDYLDFLPPRIKSADVVLRAPLAPPNAFAGCLVFF